MATIKQTLVDLFELDKMSPEKANETVDRLSKLIFQSVLMRALPTLSEKDMDSYEKILEEGQGPEVLFKFLGEKVPGFEEMISEEAEALRSELAGDMEAIKA